MSSATVPKLTSMPDSDIRVMLVDDHRLVRFALKHLLEECEGIRVVGEAASGEDALLETQRCRPDVVLMDMHMPGIGGMEASKRLLQAVPDVKIVVVSAVKDEPFPARLLEAGASAYVSKDCEPEELLEAIRKSVRGQRHLSAGVASKLALSLLDGRENSLFDKLSRREMQILLMVAQGLAIPDIALSLSVSPKTVSTYRYRLFEKLGVHNDVSLTRLAIRHGLVDADGDFVVESASKAPAS